MSKLTDYEEHCRELGEKAFDELKILLGDDAAYWVARLAASFAGHQGQSSNLWPFESD